MDILEKLAALEKEVLEGDSAQIRKQHSRGQLTARERLSLLLDPGSFVEEFMLAETRVSDFGLDRKKRPTDGVVAGHGKIEGRAVCVFAQDRTVMAGSVGSVHAEKIAYVTDMGRTLGLPVIGLHDSVGGRIQEGLDVTGAIGRMFYANVKASGVVPQISAIMGISTGVSTYSPALTDFIFMVEGTSQMFITGPRVIKEVLGEEVEMEELGGARVHASKSGVSDLTAAGEKECLSAVRRLVGFLPSSCFEAAPRVRTGDDPDRRDPELAGLVPEELRKGYDVRKVLGRLVDSNDFFELKPEFAPNIVIGFGRLDGRTVGWVASQPQHLAGTLDVDAADKASRFIRFCDAFNIPIVTLVDVPGFYPGTRQEHRGIIRHGAKLLYAYAESTVPKVTLYLRKGYGGAKQALCTREMGADHVFVWPGVELAMMGGAGAVNVLYRRELEEAENPGQLREEKIREYNERFSGPFAAAAKGFAQAIIRPEETRRRLIRSMELLATKRTERSPRKHGIMPV